MSGTIERRNLSPKGRWVGKNVTQALRVTGKEAGFSGMSWNNLLNRLLNIQEGWGREGGGATINRTNMRWRLEHN